MTTINNTGAVIFKPQASNGGTANNSGACGSIQNPQGYIPTNDMQFFNKISSGPLTYTMIANDNFTKLWINSDHDEKVYGGPPYTDDCSLISLEIKETPPILGNKVCCDQTIPNTVLNWPYTANPVDQDASTSITTFTGNQISYKWEVYNDAQGNWNAVTPETFTSSYSPIGLHGPVRLRRIAYVDVPLSTGPYHWNTAPSPEISIKPQPILGNQICCGLTAYIKSNTPTGTLTSANGTSVYNTIGTVYFEWQYSYNNSTWVSIPNTNSLTYEPKYLVRATYFRRVAYTMMQPSGYPSNSVLINVETCTRPSIDEGNSICGDQYFYNLTAGSGSVTPLKIYGSHWKPDAYGALDYEWRVSYDQGTSWTTVGPSKDKEATDESRNWDLTPPVHSYSNWWYGRKEVWYKRVEYRAYDSWDCGPLNVGSCGNEWHEKGHSNIVRMILSTLPDPNEISITGVSNINGKSINCGTTLFQLGLTGVPDLYAVLYRVDWSVVDNIDWKVSAGGVWGAEIMPWVTNTTGLTHATIRAKLTAWDGRVIEKDFVVTSPPVPTITLDKAGPLNICKGVGISVTGTGSGGTGTRSYNYTTTLNGIVPSGSGDDYSLFIPATQTNYSPQQLTITVTDANGCSMSKSITVNPDGEGWIHDQPWIAGGTHLPAIGDVTGNGNTYANIVAEQSGNIYYVGSDGKLQPTYNSLNTYQWDAANLQWRNFPFPKYEATPFNGPTVDDAAGPLAISEDPATHVRRIYYVTVDGGISYIQSKGGYVDEFTYVDANATNGTTTNWHPRTPFLGVNGAVGGLTPLSYSDGRIIYKTTAGLRIVGPAYNSLSTLLVANAQGHSFIVTATNRLIYIDANNNIKVANINIDNTLTDVTPTALNGIYAGSNSSLVYSDAKQYLFFVAGRNSSDAHFGKIGLYDFSTNQLYYTDDITNTAAPAFFKAPSLTINKVTGVCYAGGASTSPDGVSDKEVYQCFINTDDGQLLVRRLNSKDSPSLNDGYGGISIVSERKLFTDYNLFFVSSNSNKIHMDYYFSGGCGPGITKMAFDPDHINVAESKEETTATEASIIPNPTKGDFQVYYTQLKEAEIEILVYSALGELVHQSNKGVVPAGNNIFAVENTQFTSGLYFVKVIENGTLSFTGKMMVQK